MEATDDSTLQQVLDSEELSCRFECGINKPSSCYHIVDKPTILKLFCLHFIILHRKTEIDQLVEGLAVVGFIDFLKHPGPARSLLTSIGSTKLTSAKIEELFGVCFSATGSNKRSTEVATTMMWLEFLKDVEGRHV